MTADLRRRVAAIADAARAQARQPQGPVDRLRRALELTITTGDTQLFTEGVEGYAHEIGVPVDVVVASLERLLSLAEYGGRVEAPPETQETGLCASQSAPEGVRGG